MGSTVRGRPPAVPMDVSAELLGQSDDALRPTQEAEPVAVLVLRDLADELGTVGTARATRAGAKRGIQRDESCIARSEGRSGLVERKMRRST